MGSNRYLNIIEISLIIFIFSMNKFNSPNKKLSTYCDVHCRDCPISRHNVNFYLIKDLKSIIKSQVDDIAKTKGFFEYAWKDVQKPSKYQPKTFEEYLEKISHNTSKYCQNMYNKVAKYKELMVKILVD